MTSKPWFGCDPGKAKVEEASCRGSPPIVTNLSRIQDAEMNGAKGQKGKKGHQIQSRNKLEMLMDDISLVFNQMNFKMNAKPKFREITTGLQCKASMFSIQYIVVLVCIHFSARKHIIIKDQNNIKCSKD